MNGHILVVSHHVYLIYVLDPRIFVDVLVNYGLVFRISFRNDYVLVQEVSKVVLISHVFVENFYVSLESLNIYQVFVNVVLVFFEVVHNWSINCVISYVD